MLTNEEMGREPFEGVSELKYSELEDSDMFRSYESSILDSTLSSARQVTPPADHLMAALAAVGEEMTTQEKKFAQHFAGSDGLKREIFETAKMKGTLISLADILAQRVISMFRRARHVDGEITK